MACAACAVATSTSADAGPRIEGVLGLGGASIVSPDDAIGEPTLLYGSSFHGLAVRPAARIAWRVAGPLDLGVELGIGRYRLTGFAEVDDLRRDITLTSTNLELLGGLEVGGHRGAVRPFGALSVGVRIGLSAKAVDERSGFTSDEPAPEIATASSLLLGFGGGARFRATERLAIPVAFRANWAPTYGTTTRDRLDGYRDLSDPGAFVVDANWTWLFEVGVSWGPAP